MRITIDTKHDNHDDIKHVIQFLTNFLATGGTSMHPVQETVDTTNLMSMFTDDEIKKDIPDTPPDFSSFISLTRQNQEKKHEIPKVEFF